MVKVISNNHFYKSTLMDFNNLMGLLQLALAAIQLKLDHFSKSKHEGNEDFQKEFNKLGDAIITLEYALAKTVSFVGRTDERVPNPNIARLWKEASHQIREIPGNAELADIFFDKYLFWENPNFFNGRNNFRLQRISLDNVLDQLRILRVKHDTMSRAIL